MNTPDPAIPALETARLRLRPLDDSDQPLYVDLYTQPDTMRFIGQPLTPEAAITHFNRVVLRQSRPGMGGQTFAIEEKSTRHRLGICATTNIDTHSDSVEAGVMLLPPFQAQGYAREALTALIDGIFTHLPINEVKVRFSGLSLAAVQLNRRMGLRPLATMPQDTGSLSVRTCSMEKATWLLR